MLSPKEFQDLYVSMYEAMDPEERALRRAEVADRKASRMDSKVADKYAGSEAQSAAREDKKSTGKHIHGMADSYEVEGDMLDEVQAPFAGERELKKIKARTKQTKVTFKKPEYLPDLPPKKKSNSPSYLPKLQVSSFNPEGDMVDETSHLETDMNKRRRNNEKAVEDMKKTKAHADMVRAVRKKFDEQVTKEELELQLRAHLRERALDPSEKKEKENVYKAIKPSKLAKTYPEKSPKELKSLRYAISTAQAKKNMDTSRSDKRYGVEG